MNDFDLNTKLPIPRARQPLRERNVTSEKVTYRLNNSDGALITKRMHDVKEQSKSFLDHANDYDDYTEDEDDENIDDSESFGNFSRSFTPECSSSSAYSPPQVRERSQRNPSTTRSVNIANSSLSQTQPHKHPKKSCISYRNFFVFSTVIIIILYIMNNIHETTQEKNVSETNETNTIDLVAVDKLLDESMQIIRAQFPHQKPAIWNDIASGIYDVAMYPQKPTVIILFGNDTDTLNCLAQMVGELSCTILGSDNYLALTPVDFPNDVGTTIYNLKEEIMEKKVLIVQDLLNVNAEAMKAFHNFCDRQNPLIKKAIYIMTIIVDEYKPFQNELRFIDKQISNKLSGKIDKDILHPLVTRLTDGVIIQVSPESSTDLYKRVCTLATPPNKRL